MADDQTKEAQDRIMKTNGAADWHCSTTYEDSELCQVVSIRPVYDDDDEPREGSVTIHVLHSDDDHFGEAEVTISAKEMDRICRGFLAHMESDQEHYQIHQQEDEDEESDEEDEEEESDDEDEEEEE